MLLEARAQGLGLGARAHARVWQLCRSKDQHSVAAGNPSHHLTHTCTVTPKGNAYPKRRSQGGQSEDVSFYN